MQSDIGACESQPRTFIVDSISDTIDGNDGAGQLTLREALNLANANPGNDTVQFSTSVFNVPRVISLAGTELLITDSLTMNGPGTGLLTINANKFSTCIDVLGYGGFAGFPRLDVTMNNLTLTGGSSSSTGGGLAINEENVTLTSQARTVFASTAPPVALSVAVTSTPRRVSAFTRSVTVPAIVPMVGAEAPPGP